MKPATKRFYQVTIRRMFGNTPEGPDEYSQKNPDDKHRYYTSLARFFKELDDDGRRRHSDFDIRPEHHHLLIESRQQMAAIIDKKQRTYYNAPAKGYYLSQNWSKWESPVAQVSEVEMPASQHRPAYTFYTFYQIIIKPQLLIC